MIHVVGSINLDLVARLAALPRPGETVLGTALLRRPGGKGGNQALAARRAGAEVRMIGCVGRDADGRDACALLRRDGVDLSGVAEVDMATGVALIQIDSAGENAITVLPGANGALDAAHVRARLKDLGSGDVVLVQQEVPRAATLAALAMAAAAGAVGILNVAPARPDDAELAVAADVVVANETEFEILTGDPAGRAAAEAWARRTGRRLALTLGAGGAVLVDPDRAVSARPDPIEAVDTVGAGDTFCGYLAAGLAAGRVPEEALHAAVAASARACLSEGAQEAMPWADTGDPADVS